MAEVVMPQLGETVTEGTITRWFKQVGDSVELDEVLFEVSTDKVDSEVPSPVAGVLAEILVPEGGTVAVGAPIARLSAGDAEPEPASEPAPEGAPAPEPAPDAEPGPAAPVAPVPQVPAPAAAAPAADPTGRVLSPIVRRLLAEHGLDAAAITGTGVGGRITRADAEAAIAARGPVPAVAPPSTSPVGAAPASPPPSSPTGHRGERDTVVPLSNIRRRTGEHMVRSMGTSPHAYTIVEVDYEAVERVRTALRHRFRSEEGFSLTYLPFIARAVIDAIDEFPHINATVGDQQLVVHNYVNLSVAVDLDFEGLLAPVVRDSDQKRLRPIAREIHDLATRARSRKLSADEITGGTFTLTNAGSYGTHLVLAVINQPQVAILSTDGVRRKPVVVTAGDGTEAIAIHSVGMLALGWDHRAFDGAYAAAFMDRVRQIIETRDWEAEL